MTITPTRQRNAVSEGAALGLLMCGRDELPYGKVEIDLSFAGAWRDWSYANRFPQVSTDLRNGLDPIHALTRADAGTKTYSLYWDTSSGIAICRRGSWEDEEIDFDAVADTIDGDVPAAGWQALGKDFLTRLEK